MEADKNPIPEIHLFPRLERVARAIGNLFCMHQLASHGDHFIPNTGGGPALDRELYDGREQTPESFAED